MTVFVILVALGTAALLTGQWARRREAGADVIRAHSGKRYRLGRLHGHGGMGAIHEGTGPRGQRVAIKLLQSRDEEFQARFEREIEICSTLHHPQITAVLDWGRTECEGETCPFMVLEWVDGVTLRQRLREARPDAGQALQWVRQLLEALRVVHQAGIVHRDVNPDNIMVTPNGQLKLIDFGIARVGGSVLTFGKVEMGTPLYMSPEHFNAPSTIPASDLYSLGIVFYEMLTGHVPYELGGRAPALIRQVLKEERPDLRSFNANVDPALAAVVMRMIQCDPARRYATTGEVLDALQGF
ncbi:MAG: serine/threonine-protein kinase [Candidatus Xenobia bacterium]